MALHVMFSHPSSGISPMGTSKQRCNGYGKSADKKSGDGRERRTVSPLTPLFPTRGEDKGGAVMNLTVIGLKKRLTKKRRFVHLGELCVFARTITGSGVQGPVSWVNPHSTMLSQRLSEKSRATSPKFP